MRKTTLISLMGFLMIVSAANIGLSQAEYVPNEVLFKFQRGASESVRQDAIHSVQGEVIGTFRQDADLFHMRIPATVGTERAIEALKRNPNVKYAEKNYIRYANLNPNDPRFDDLWGMHNTGQTGGTPDVDIDAPEAWDIFTGTAEVVVGVIDTGVDYNHEDLSSNMWTNLGEIPGNGIDDDANGYIDDVHGWDWVNNDNDPWDDHSHGTHCSGTIGGIGDNNKGVAGVNWIVRIMALKFLSSSGSGSTANAVKAVDYATENGAWLTSNSWGGGGYSLALWEAIDRADQAGILFVCASGNSYRDIDPSPYYPASYNNPNLITVTATDHNDNKASFANWGLTSVDVGAPGVNVLSSIPSNGYGYKSGTSMACPHAAGVCALLWGYYDTLTHMEVKQRLMDTVRPVPSLLGRCVTGGMVNAYDALGAEPPEPPTAPSGLSAGAVACDQIDLSWTDNSDNEDGFNIERSTDGTTFSQMDSVGANVTSYSDTTVAEITAYHYRVIAFNSGGDSAPSTPASAETGLCGVPPDAPDNLIAVAPSCSQVDLTWAGNSENEDGFVIERSNNGRKFKEIARVEADITSYSDTSVAENKTYWYRVLTFNTEGYSGYSNTISVSTPSCGEEPPAGPPAPPSGLTATARGKAAKIALRWTDNSNNEEGFHIYRGTTANNYDTTFNVGPNTTSYVDSTVSSQTTYYYKVCAWNSSGANCSEEASATTK